MSVATHVSYPASHNVLQVYLRVMFMQVLCIPLNIQNVYNTTVIVIVDQTGLEDMYGYTCMGMI